MPVKMTPRQLEFWTELLAPFPESSLSYTKRGGKELTYLDKRSITNRLDSVCGPDGWFPEYEPTARGYKCRLSICVPTRGEADIFMHKEDGAGFEEMGATNKTTGEFEYDVDNDEKSGYTNAFRRAAQDAWGIGRYLYKKGIPTFLDPNASAGASAAQNAVDAAVDARMTPRPNPAIPPKELADRQAPMPSTRDLPAKAPEPAQAKPKYDNFKIPKPGKSVFMWAKEMEKEFETKLTDGMASDGETEGWGSTFLNWNDAQVNTICLKAITYIRELPSYKGQYEFLFPGGVADTKIPQTKGSGPNTPPPTPGVNVADLRRTLMASITALITKQTGKAPETAGLKAAFNTIASSAKNSQGFAGEIPESLSKLTDATWISNMITLVEAKIATECTEIPTDGDPSIPF